MQREHAREMKEQFSDYYITSLDEWAFVQEAAEEKLLQQLGVKSLKGFAIDQYPSRRQKRRMVCACHWLKL